MRGPLKHSFEMSLAEFSEENFGRLPVPPSQSNAVRDAYAAAGAAHYERIRDIPCPSEFKTEEAYKAAAKAYRQELMAQHRAAKEAQAA